MNTNSRVVQEVKRDGIINTDAESRMIASYTKGRGLFGGIKHPVGRSIKVEESGLWLNLIIAIVLMIVIVIAVFFKANIEALIF